MATYTEHVSLVKPLSTEKYDISVTNTNMDLIDSALNRIDTKNEEQDNLLATKESLNTHTGNTENPHEVTKSQVGLSNVDNKSSETIRSEITKENVTNALGYTPYTPAEVDNKFSALETKIDWKESVETYNDIEITYPDPEDGWTVNVKDTNYTYRYNGEEWISISANAIPKATNELDGLLSKEDHEKYDALTDKLIEVNQKNVSQDIIIDNLNTKISQFKECMPNNIKFWIGNTIDFDAITIKDNNTQYTVTEGDKIGVWVGAVQVANMGSGSSVVLLGEIFNGNEVYVDKPEGFTSNSDLLFSQPSFVMSSTEKGVYISVVEANNNQLRIRLVDIAGVSRDTIKVSGILYIYYWKH